MKSLIIIISVALAVTVSSAYLYNPNTNSEIQTPILDEIESKYGDLLYHAYFSLQETRPFSIIQFDATVETYSSQWISSQEYLLKLKNNDLEMLKQSLTKYLNEMPENERNLIYTKLKLWCMVEKHFAMIEEEFGLERKNIVNALSKIDSFSENYNKFPNPANKLTEIELDEAYTNSVNNFVSANKPARMQYYSKLFAELGK